jgi:NAD(P)H-nitrite reductase large subunit
VARRHVLIGSGPAAVAAAEAIRREDIAAEITMVSADPHGYYSRPGLAYYLAKEIPEDRLFPFTSRDFAGLGVSFVSQRVAQIDPTAHSVTLGSGHDVPYDRLLIATGSYAIPLGVRGVELDGVVKLDDMEDARNLIQRGQHAKEAVVVGGGITALEIVEGLRTRGVHVHYLMRKDRYWSNVLSEAESRIVEDGLRSGGVEIHYFTEVARILGVDGRVTGVETQNAEEIPADLVAVAIGVLPKKQLGESGGLECGRGILVDEFLRTSARDVFAAGDVAEVRAHEGGKGLMEVLWNSAVAKGRVAGSNMAAEVVHRYVPSVALNVTRLAGRTITIMGTVGNGKDEDVKGIARGDSETWRQLGDAAIVEHESRNARVRMALTDRTIVGAIVMGDQALSFPLQEIIASHADVSALAERLREGDASVAELVDRFWRDWKAGRA